MTTRIPKIGVCPDCGGTYFRNKHGYGPCGKVASRPMAPVAVQAVPVERREISEERTLDDLEHVIEKGRVAFLEVGEALSEVRDRRLYREAGYKTFEQYTRERWHFGASRARQIIGATKSVTAGNALGDIKNERQARALRARPTEVEVIQDAPGVCPMCGRPTERGGRGR